MQQIDVLQSKQDIHNAERACNNNNKRDHEDMWLSTQQ